MNCVYENYLNIYNIKLMKENTSLIKKKISNMFFILFILKNFFINSTKHIFVFKTKTVFHILVSKYNFFFF